CLSIITLLISAAASAAIPSQSTLVPSPTRSIDQVFTSVPMINEYTAGRRPTKSSHLSNPESSYVPAKPLIPLDDNMEPIRVPGLVKKKAPSLLDRIIGHFRGSQAKSEADVSAAE
ncbi:hypothetical protein DSO57_1017303, partial [Entomophthora muscae]